MPFLHIGVWSSREAFSRDSFGEESTSFAWHIKDRNRPLYENSMLFWTQQQLQCLPSYISIVS